VARLPTRSRIFRALWTADGAVSSALFEIRDGLRRAGSAYSSWLYRYFAVRGPKKWVMSLLDDGATLGTLFAFALLAYALPAMSLKGDVWNRGRQYAITMTDVNGVVIGHRGIRQDDAIPLDQISPNLVKAVLATEDARFFDHFGVDLIGTLRAIVRNSRSQKVQGGSSITQQVAKNLFLSPERTITRKVHEAFLALWIESHATKPEILKLYLDRSYLGGGAYGVEAAAQFYFSKSARDVTLAESAVLAGLFKSPRNYAPHINPDASRQRANTVLFRMLAAGFITQGELMQARRNPPIITATKDAASPDWFMDFAEQDTLSALQKHGLQKEYVIEVKTSIDSKLQAASQAIINDSIDTLGPLNDFTQASSVTMAPDGAVKAIVGGRDYEQSQFNRATKAERQSGSSFKPYVYLTALLEGHKPTDIVFDGPVSIGNWSPGNYKDTFAGRETLSMALAKSHNSIPVKLLIEMGGREGVKKITRLAHTIGLQGKLDTWVTMVLGTSALTLIDLSTGYATFAGGGKLATPYAVLEIRRPNGHLLYQRSTSEAPAPQVVPEEKIAELNSMLGDVISIGTAKSANLGWAPEGGKTGTNQSYRDAWFVGFTAHNVTGVWVGNDDFTPMKQVTGGRIPAPIWKRIMEVAEEGQPATALPGLPITEVHIAFAAEMAKTRAAEQAAATPVQIASAGSSTAVDETPASTPDTGNPSTDPTTEVLNGMFDLFEKKPVAATTRKSAPRLVTAPASGNQTAATPNTGRRTFLDKLFGINRNAKPKKKKTKPFGGFFDF
jgi:penicillin-binding protein 1A